MVGWFSSSGYRTRSVIRYDVYVNRALCRVIVGVTGVGGRTDGRWVASNELLARSERARCRSEIISDRWRRAPPARYVVLTPELGRTSARLRRTITRHRRVHSPSEYDNIPKRKSPPDRKFYYRTALFVFAEISRSAKWRYSTWPRSDIGPTQRYRAHAAISCLATRRYRPSVDVARLRAVTC